jgi:excisionase family DNA binding protein
MDKVNLTIIEAAEYLGISPRQLRTLAHIRKDIDGVLPHWHLNGKNGDYRFNRYVLDEWTINNHRQLGAKDKLAILNRVNDNGSRMVAGTNDRGSHA